MDGLPIPGRDGGKQADSADLFRGKTTPPALAYSPSGGWFCFKVLPNGNGFLTHNDEIIAIIFTI